MGNRGKKQDLSLSPTFHTQMIKVYQNWSAGIKHPSLKMKKKKKKRNNFETFVDHWLGVDGCVGQSPYLPYLAHAQLFVMETK